MTKEERIQAIERIINKYWECLKNQKEEDWDSVNQIAIAIEEAIGVSQEVVFPLVVDFVAKADWNNPRRFIDAVDCDYLAKEISTNKDIITIKEK